MTFLSIKEGLHNDIILQTYGIITQSFFVIRRNISGLNFKGFLTEGDISQIDDILVSFIKKLPSDYLGNIYSSEDKDYEAKTKLFLETFHLTSNVNPRILNNETPFGSKIYLSDSRDLSILTNYEDHFLLIFEFKYHSILKALQKLEFLIKIFDKTLQELNQTPAHRPSLGFLTLNPNFIGLGISLNYSLKLREKGPNEMQIELNPE